MPSPSPPCLCSCLVPLSFLPTTCLTACGAACHRVPLPYLLPTLPPPLLPACPHPMPPLPLPPVHYYSSASFTSTPTHPFTCCPHIIPLAPRFPFAIPFPSTYIPLPPCLYSTTFSPPFPTFTCPVPCLPSFASLVCAHPRGLPTLFLLPALGSLPLPLPSPFPSSIAPPVPCLIWVPHMPAFVFPTLPTVSSSLGFTCDPVVGCAVVLPACCCYSFCPSLPILALCLGGSCPIHTHYSPSSGLPLHTLFPRSATFPYIPYLPTCLTLHRGLCLFRSSFTARFVIGSYTVHRGLYIFIFMDHDLILFLVVNTSYCLLCPCYLHGVVAAHL